MDVKKEDDQPEHKIQHKKIERKFPIWLWITLGVLSLIILSIIFLGTGITVSKPFSLGSTCKEVQVPYESQEEYMKTEYYTETVPYTDTECDYKNLVYSATNFENNGNCVDYDERCKDYFLGICTEKETYCVEKRVISNLDLKNLDSERGTWVIKFSYFLDGQLINSENMAKSLYPQESGSIGVIWTISGEENNRKDDKYSYNVITIPTKKVCKDVIKYKEVKKERQVTAYKPVTKYKTEQKCY